MAGMSPLTDRSTALRIDLADRPGYDGLKADLSELLVYEFGGP